MPERFALIKQNKLILTGVLLYFLLILVLPKIGHGGDNYCWGLWTTIIKNGGLAAAYNEGSPVNYLPLYLYVLKLYTLIFTEAELYPMTYWLKSASLIFDIGSIILLCNMIKDRPGKIKYFLLGLLNPGYLYNTYFWNQVDAILTFFLFYSFYQAYKNHLVSSIILFLLGLNFKLQGIIFLPMMVLIWLPQLTIKKILKTLSVGCLLQVLIILPYIIAGNAGNILKVITESVDYFPKVSMNAFNFWYLVLKGDLMKVYDTGIFFWGISYKHFGMAVFFGFSAIVLWPVLLKTYQILILKTAQSHSLKMLLLCSTLIPCFFFFFNTQMHERYIHPALIFSTALAFLYKEWGQWILLSVTNALSLESICQLFGFNNYGTMIYHSRFLAACFGLVIIILLISWLKEKPFKMAN